MKKYINLFAVITMLCLFLTSCGQTTNNKNDTSETNIAVSIDTSNSESINPLPDKSETNTSDEIKTEVDYEEIILERANDLHELVYKYMNIDKSELCFQWGEEKKIDEDYSAYEVLSDKIRNYSDFKALYSDTISGDYFDYITNGWFKDIEDKLYYIKPISGLLGTYETWYIGYEVKENQIIGHFAELRWGDGDGDELKNSDFINDLSNYKFYDIIVENIDGKYIITRCVIVGEEGQDHHEPHGIYYNSGIVDRSMITNEKIKPKS